MEIRATPSVEATQQCALLVALERDDMGDLGSTLYDQSWRRAGLFEAVDDDAQAVYALSPRSTRGATRA